LYNNGTLTVYSGYEVNMVGGYEGTLVNYGSMFVDEGSQFAVIGGAVRTSGYFVAGGDIFVHDAQFEMQSGQVVVEGTMSLSGDGNGYGYGTLLVDSGGYFQDYGTITVGSGGVVVNNDTIEEYEVAAISVAGGTFWNYNNLEVCGATLEVTDGGYLYSPNILCVYSGSTVVVAGGGETNSDSVMDLAGWTGVYDGSTFTILGDENGGGVVNNAGELDVYYGGSMSIHDGGTVAVATGATLYTGMDYYSSAQSARQPAAARARSSNALDNSSAQIILGDGGAIQNSGAVVIGDGGTLDMIGQLINMPGATVNNAGQILVGGNSPDLGSMLGNNTGIITLTKDTDLTGVTINGTVNISSDVMVTARNITFGNGMFLNGGLLIWHDNAISQLIASVANAGTIAFDGDISLSRTTLASGNYEIWGTATNDGTLSITAGPFGASVTNYGTLYWNSNDLGTLSQIVNRGEVICWGLSEKHFDGDSYLTNFSSAFSIETDVLGNGSGLGPLSLPIDGQWTPGLNPGSLNEFTVTYNPVISTIFYVTGNKTYTLPSVIWPVTGPDVLLLTVATQHSGNTPGWIHLEDVELTPAGIPTRKLPWEAQAFLAPSGNQDTLRISGATLRSGFTLTGKIQIEDPRDGNAFILKLQAGTDSTTHAPFEALSARSIAPGANYVESSVLTPDLYVEERSSGTSHRSFAAIVASAKTFTAPGGAAPIVRWTVVPVGGSAGAQPFSGTFGAGGTIITFSPEGSRTYLLSAWNDANNNGLLDLGEVSHGITVHIVRVTGISVSDEELSLNSLILQNDQTTGDLDVYMKPTSSTALIDVTPSFDPADSSTASHIVWHATSGSYQPLSGVCSSADVIQLSLPVATGEWSVDLGFDTDMSGNWSSVDHMTYHVKVHLLKIQVVGLTFGGSGMQNVSLDDGNGQYPSTWQWWDNNQNGIIDGTTYPNGTIYSGTGGGTERACPLSYVRSIPGKPSTLALSAVFHVTTAVPAGLRIQGISSVSGLTFGAMQTASSYPVFDYVAGAIASMIDSQLLTIAWQFSLDGITWHEFERTSNRLYVTGTSANNAFETVLNLGCDGAKGMRPGDSTDSEVQRRALDKAIFNEIWAKEFAGLHVERADGTPLCYYNPMLTSDTKTSQLLKDGNGQCGSWAHLFIDTLRA
jgi:hypothetical protein